MFKGGPRGRRNSPKFSSNRAADSSLHVAGSGVGGIGVWEALAAGSPLCVGAGSVQNIVRTPPDSPIMTAGALRHCDEPRAPGFCSNCCGGNCPPISSGFTPLIQAAGGQGFGTNEEWEPGGGGATERAL